MRIRGNDGEYWKYMENWMLGIIGYFGIFGYICNWHIWYELHGIDEIA